jgi:hypothetical protein
MPLKRRSWDILATAFYSQVGPCPYRSYSLRVADLTPIGQPDFARQVVQTSA